MGIASFLFFFKLKREMHIQNDKVLKNTKEEKKNQENGVIRPDKTLDWV